MAQFEFQALALILLIFGIEGKEEMSNIITLKYEVQWTWDIDFLS